MTIQFLSAPGRVVMGSVHTANPLDMNGKQREKPQYFFALAVNKNHPMLQGMINAIYQEAWAGYSNNKNILSRIEAFMQPGVQFAWKIKDGDDEKYKDKPGCAGCLLFMFSTTIEPQVVGPDNKPIPAGWLKTGYYADVYVGCAVNGQLDHTAGVYLNPLIVRLLGVDDEIHPGPVASEVMGAAQSMGQAWAAPAGGVPPTPQIMGHASAQAAPAAAPQVSAAPSAPAPQASTIASPTSGPRIPGFRQGGSGPGAGGSGGGFSGPGAGGGQ